MRMVTSLALDDTTLRLRTAQRPRNEAKPSEQQSEHHDRVEEGGLAKIDVDVHQHARQDDREAESRQQPADDRLAVVKQEADADQERQKRRAEPAISAKRP